MKSKVVTIKELTENNPTLCLSALRVFGNCTECPMYKKSPNKLKCNPVISEEMMKRSERREKLLQEIRDAKRALKDMEEQK